MRSGSTVRSWCPPSRCTAMTRATRSRCKSATPIVLPWSSRSILPIRPSRRSSPTGSARRGRSPRACYSCAAGSPRIPPTLDSIACWRRPRGCRYRSTCTAGRLDQGIALIRSHPDVQIVVDHLGLVQPHQPPVPKEPWTELPKVLTLAQLPNVAIKISGACTLSHEPFPYNDIWDPVCRVIDAFGIDRCLWGTDWTRAVKFLTYAQGVDAFRATNRISDSDKAKLMGGTLARIYGWSPRKRA